MEKGSASLELRYLLERISKRVGLGRSLARTEFTPKCLDLPPGRRMLVLSPHPDDDAIGCGGTILKAIEHGRDVRIVYLSLPISGAESREERRREAIRALQVMGVKDYSLPEAEFPGSHQEILKLIRSGMEGWAPDCIFVPSPIENHGQHISTFLAYMDLLKEGLGCSTALYEVWATLVPNLLVDITAQVERKAEAIAAHATQVRTVDYVRMAKALNTYRAASGALAGQAEAFLFAERKAMLELFG